MQPRCYYKSKTAAATCADAYLAAALPPVGKITCTTVLTDQPSPSPVKAQQYYIEYYTSWFCAHIPIRDAYSLPTSGPTLIFVSSPLTIFLFELCKRLSF